MQLNRWLSQKPQPTTLLVVTNEGDRVLKVEGTVRNRWPNAIHALEKMRWSEIRAIDKDGAELRIRTRDEEPEEQEESTLKPQPGKETELVLLAGLIADAYRNNSLQLAFDAQCKIVETLSSSFQSVQTAWLKTLEQRARELMEAGGDPDTLTLQQMFGMFVQGNAAGISSRKGATIDTTGGPTAPGTAGQ